MKALYLSFLFFFFSINVVSQTLDRKTALAIEHISNGYAKYGIDELNKAAATNSVIAQFYLAVCYEQGWVVEKNEVEAFRLFRRTAERGLPDGMFQLASFYERGVVVAQNQTRYEEWMKRFQNKGGKLILPDFGQIYNEGLKHPENYALNPQQSGTDAKLMAQQGGTGSTSQTVNHITIVQQTPSPTTTPTPAEQPQQTNAVIKSDVDEQIPSCSLSNETTFALIIANEHYQDVAGVPHANHDGEIFAAYCQRTLGLPKEHVHFIKDATFNNMKREVNLIAQIAAAYQGKAKIIFYYAGHGIPDEVSKGAYLLPVDGYGSDMSTCYSLNDLYMAFGKMPASQIVMLLDACFSGSLRGEGMLASARGVTIKAKSASPKGNMVVLSAAQGDETAYPYQEKGHGLFSYYLLKRLQESKGESTLAELADYVKEQVVKKSLVVNGKQQTPTIIPSLSLGDSWRQWTLK